MVKCKVYSSFEYAWIEKMVNIFYDTYKIVDVKFSTAIDVKLNCVNYSVMIIYKEK